MKKNLFSLFLLAALTVHAGKVKVYTTTADGVKQMECTTTKTLRQQCANTLTLNPGVQYQEMDGFGYAITYSACYNLLKMSPADRHELLVRTYSRTKGYGVSYARISIGCNDFSSTEYSLCDEKGLEHFRLYEDETKYVIPVLKEILAINPDLKIMAAPWSCPKWMKVKDLQSLTPYDSWTSGHLNPACYETYADYFVKFIQTFKEQGIDIYAVTPQNEPLNKGNCASLFLPWAEEAAFINKMAPAFKKAGLKTKIYCYDHNYNYDNMDDQQDYPVNLFNALDGKMEGSELVVGSAWHDYGGRPSELDDINQKAPNMEVIFTESSIGTWNDGRNLQKHLIADMNNLVFNTVNRKSKAVMVWNFMLDLNRGPNLDGGCQTCFGAIDIDQNDYRTLHYNSHYFVLAHASAAVKPGAHRIAASLNGSASDVSYVAFQNPDGTYGVLFINNGAAAELSISSDSKSFAKVQLPAKSVVSVVM